MHRIPAEIAQRALALVNAAASQTSSAAYSPLDRSVVAQVPHSSADDVAGAFGRARVAQVSWAQTSVRERTRIISRFHDAVLRERSLLTDIVQIENGKCRNDAHDEVIDVAMTCRYYAQTAAKLLAPQHRLSPFPILTKAIEQQLPVGVVGLISPWNYPLTLGVGDLIPAVLAGNAVVWKPDLQTMLSGLVPLTLLFEAGLPRDLVQVVAGEGPTVGPLVIDQADFVMFTGSTATGRRVAEQAARRLVGVSLELGGKNSCVVLPDADVDAAVEIAVRGAFSGAGQVCVGTERIVVHRSIADEFTKKFVRRVEALRLSSGFDWDAEMGALTSEGQLARTEERVADAVARGAKLLTGGHRRADVGPLVYAPTVLAEVTGEMQVCSSETFGPVCTLHAWSDEAELLGIVNDSQLGLAASIVTRDEAAARRLAAKLRAGGVSINDPFPVAWAAKDGSMGGHGESGIGRRHGSAGLLRFTEAQTVVAARFLPLRPQRPFTGARWGWLLATAMRVLKWMRRP